MGQMKRIYGELMDPVETGNVSTEAVEKIAAEYNLDVEWVAEAVRDMLEDIEYNGA